MYIKQNVRFLYFLPKICNFSGKNVSFGKVSKDSIGKTYFLNLRQILLPGHRFFSSEATLKRTTLYDFHVSNGGKMVPFAGYEMPVQYGSYSISDSHLHTRNCASIFDVSHMLQSKILGKDCIRFMESLVVADLEGLKENHATLTLYTNERGGIIDDLIVTRTLDDYLYVVSNAGCIEKDVAHVQKKISEFQKKGGDARFEIITNRALLAVQGPKASPSLQALVEYDLSQLTFMTTTVTKICSIEDCRISRCGYTGEDGFEISVPAASAAVVTQALLKLSDVKLAGLGARDTLRLEAGLCLYGSDMDENTTPVEAGLVWTIGKRRKDKADFPGADIILEQIRSKPKKRRVGFLSKGPPARAHSAIFDESGEKVGEITSGGPSPCLKTNIAMGYVRSDLAKIGSKVLLEVRKQKTQAEVVKMPFVQTHYYIPK